MIPVLMRERICNTSYTFTSIFFIRHYTVLKWNILYSSKTEAGALVDDRERFPFTGLNHHQRDQQNPVCIHRQCNLVMF